MCLCHPKALHSFLCNHCTKAAADLQWKKLLHCPRMQINPLQELLVSCRGRVKPGSYRVQCLSHAYLTIAPWGQSLSAHLCTHEHEIPCSERRSTIKPRSIFTAQNIKFLLSTLSEARKLVQGQLAAKIPYMGRILREFSKIHSENPDILQLSGSDTVEGRGQQPQAPYQCLFPELFLILYFCAAQKIWDQVIKVFI